MRRTLSILASASLLATALAAPVSAAANGDSGALNAITDVPGVKVGQYERRDGSYLTGTTVVHTPGRAVAGVNVSGGAPGTRETDLLDPRNRVQRVDAVVLTGGSAYGLVSASGVMQWLEEHEQGFPVGPGPGDVVPIVPAAVIFDLGRGGRFTARPTAEFGYRAIASADNGAVQQGVIGAGTGAVSGGLKGGVGTASITLDNGVVVGALVVVNSAGSAVNPETCTFYAAHLEVGNEFGGLRAPKQCGGGGASKSSPEKMNTTIAVVATNAPLDKAQASKMAGVAHDGLARAISPVHTLYDGDSVFALSTGGGPPWEVSEHVADLNAVYTAAANTLSRAIVHAMLQAETVGRYESYCDAYPSACRGVQGSGAAPATAGTGAGDVVGSGGAGAVPDSKPVAGADAEPRLGPAVGAAALGLLVVAGAGRAVRSRYATLSHAEGQTHG